MAVHLHAPHNSPNSTARFKRPTRHRGRVLKLAALSHTYSTMIPAQMPPLHASTPRHASCNCCVCMITFGARRLIGPFSQCCEPGNWLGYEGMNGLYVSLGLRSHNLRVIAGYNAVVHSFFALGHCSAACASAPSQWRVQACRGHTILSGPVWVMRNWFLLRGRAYRWHVRV